MNYVKLLRKDTGLEEAAEIKTAMMDILRTLSLQPSRSGS